MNPSETVTLITSILTIIACIWLFVVVIKDKS